MGGTLLPPDFIQEVQVKTGGYEAEYRSALGGVVNVVTPSGSNQFAGKFIGYWTSHAVSGEPEAELARTPDEGIRPVRCRLQPVRPAHQGPRVVFRRLRSRVPDSRYRDSRARLLQRLDDGASLCRKGRLAGEWGEHPRADHRGRSHRVERSSASLRSVSEASLWPSSIRTPSWGASRTEAPVFPSAGRTSSGPIRCSRPPSRTSGGRTSISRPRRSRTARMLFIDAPTATWSGGAGWFLDTESEQLTVTAKATWALGEHELKAGAEYRRSKEAFNAWGWNTVTRYSVYSFFDGRGEALGSTENRIPSLFVQDSWRLGPRWVLNAGLRWAREQFVRPRAIRVQTIDNEWQPRVGLRLSAWTARNATHLRIRGAATTRKLRDRRAELLRDGAEGFNNCLQLRSRSATSTRRAASASSGSLSRRSRRFRDFARYYFDEYALGYQLTLGDRHRAGVRAIYRSPRRRGRRWTGHDRPAPSSGGTRGGGPWQQTIPAQAGPTRPSSSPLKGSRRRARGTWRRMSGRKTAVTTWDS